MAKGLLRSALAELVGTFTLVFIGAAAVTVAGRVIAQGSEVLGVIIAALAHGLILVSLVFAYGSISGGHFNPAVTLGLLVGRKTTVPTAVVYIAVQFVGGWLGALAVSVLVPGQFGVGQTVGSLTAENPWGAALFEAFLTFLLVSTVYQAAVYGGARNAAAVAIGLTLAGCILAGGVYTGASLNPARTLGPALVAGDLSYILPYFAGIFAGGAVGGLVQGYVLNPEATTSPTN
jgi:aquaporin Z